MKMKGDILTVERCSFCMPLRQRFMTWCYIKLVTQLLLVLLTTLALVEISIRFGVDTIDILIIEAFLLIFVLDFCFNMVFLDSRQRKSLRLLQISYVYNIVLLFFCSIFLPWVTVTDLKFLERIAFWNESSYDYGSFTPLILLRLLVGTVAIGVHGYITFLIRNEANQLRKWSKLIYANVTAAEAEALMLKALQAAPQEPNAAEMSNAYKMNLQKYITQKQWR